jgi:hypothetical protein
MPTRRSSPFYELLLLALVGSVALLAFSLTGRLARFARDAVAVETRFGTLAEQGISVAIAAAGGEDPTGVAAGRYLASARAALVVFDGDPVSVEILGRDADLAWLDPRMAIRVIDARRADGSVVAPPIRSGFLLVLPAGFAEERGLVRGEQLRLI